MSTQRYISTSFWDDPWVNELDPSEKFVYLYLLTNTLTNIAGIYEITDKRICFDTGYNIDTIQKILKRFHEAKKACRFKHYIVLPSWPKHQKWDKSPKIKAGIDLILKKLPEDLLKYTLSIGYQYPLNYIDLDIDTNKDTDIDKEVKKDSIEPEFLQFWEGIKKRGSKKTAKELYTKLRKTNKLPPIETLLDILTKWTESGQWDNETFIPHATTWLRQERWEDETPKPIPFNSDTLKTTEEQTAFRWFKRDNQREPTRQEYSDYYNSPEIQRKLTR